MGKTRTILMLCAAALVIPACGGGGGGGGSDGGGTPVPPSTERVSVGAASLEANHNSLAASTSSNGRHVAFQSVAGNLVPGDSNFSIDIFVRDLDAGTITRVSVSSAGVQGNDDSNEPSISSDGRYVAFHSVSTNLVSGDTNGLTDAFVRDTLAGTTSRVSLTSTGAASNDHCTFPSISADGRYVAFRSPATNLVPGDTNGQFDVFVRDTLTNTTVRASLTSLGAQSAGGGSFAPSISADGRFVAFDSLATNMVPGDTNVSSDVFVRDLVAGTTVRVSVDSLNGQGNGHSFGPDISANGLHVAFESDASNLVAGDTNTSRDIFVRNLAVGTTLRASVDSLEAQSTGLSSQPSISGDGRYVVFESFGDNIVANDTNAGPDVFVRDTVAGTTSCVSINAAGVPCNAFSGRASISSEGRDVAFNSSGTDLVSGDTNGRTDVFIRGPLW